MLVLSSTLILLCYGFCYFSSFDTLIFISIDFKIDFSDVELFLIPCKRYSIYPIKWRISLNVF